MKNSFQPLVTDTNNVLRFKENKIVTYLLDNGGLDMNALARVDFSPDDRQHFAQLIGYSVSGYSSLSYVSNVDYEIVQKLESTISVLDTANFRIAVLEDKLTKLKEALKEPIAELFEIHPGNLE